MSSARISQWSLRVQVSRAALACAGPIGRHLFTEVDIDCEVCCTHAAPLYNVEALRRWLLNCCQGSQGGLRDKPGKPVDYYHTCYCLSGYAAALAYAPHHSSSSGDLPELNPICNVMADKLAAARLHYGKYEG